MAKPASSRNISPKSPVRATEPVDAKARREGGVKGIAERAPLDRDRANKSY